MAAFMDNRIVYDTIIKQNYNIRFILSVDFGRSNREEYDGHVARWGKRRGVYRVFVEKQVGKGPLGRPRRR
jgi:hypothetical protein